MNLKLLADSLEFAQKVRLIYESQKNSVNRAEHNKRLLLALSRVFVSRLEPALREKFTDELVVLDAAENAMGTANWLLVRYAGLPHAGTVVIVVRDQKILLAQRGSAVSDANSWDLSAGGGLSSIEPEFVKRHAIQELFEEIFNVSKVPESLMQRYMNSIRSLGSHRIQGQDKRYGWIDTKNFIHLIPWQNDFPQINLNPSEVADVRWVNWDEFLEFTKQGGPLNDLRHLNTEVLEKIKNHL
jgi:8-oxo-dGTP pyrophosphatase MutT (NUDIX family)